MKKITMLLVLVSMIAFANKANAQAQFALGIKAGPNFSNIDINSVLVPIIKTALDFMEVHLL